MNRYIVNNTASRHLSVGKGDGESRGNTSAKNVQKRRENMSKIKNTMNTTTISVLYPAGHLLQFLFYTEQNVKQCFAV